VKYGIVQTLTANDRDAVNGSSKEFSAARRQKQPNWLSDCLGFDCLPQTGNQVFRYLSNLPKEVNLAEVDVMTRDVLL
jgi:hypothetical protein